MHDTLETNLKRTQEKRCPEREQAQSHAETASIYMMIAGAMNWFVVIGMANIIPVYAHLKWQTHPGIIGVVLAISELLSAIAVPIWIHVGHKKGFGRAVTYTYLPTVFFSAWMGVTDSFLIFSLCYLFNSLFNMTDEVTGTFIAEVMPREYAEEWMSANLGVAQLLLILGMLFMSVLFEFVSHDSVFYASATMSIVTFIFCYFTLVGVSKRLNLEMIAAYRKDVKRQGFDDTSSDYAIGLVHEREEFSIVLHEYNAYIESFDFWNLSRSELLLFITLTFFYAVFGTSFQVFLAWWPLFCRKKWHVGVIDANAQLVVLIVMSAISSVVAPLGIEWSSKFFRSDSSYISISNSSDDGENCEEETLVESQTHRDQVTLIHFVFVVLVCMPMWYVMIVTDISFAANWALIGALGLCFGWGISCQILLVLRFQRAGDSSQIFGIQGLAWSVAVGVLDLCVGIVWHRYGYKAIVVVPLVTSLSCLLVSVYPFHFYWWLHDEEKREN